MLTNVATDELAMKGAAVSQDILDEVVPKLVSGNWTIVSGYLIFGACTYYR